MATIASRQVELQQAVRSLERQTRPPDKLLVYYSSEPWHLDPGFETEPSINTSLDVELRRVPNLGSCRKYLHTVEEYLSADAWIVLVDDDRTFSPTVLETLLTYAKANDCVAIARGWSRFRMIRNERNESVIDNDCIRGDRVQEPREVAIVSGGFLPCFHASHVDAALLDRSLQRKYLVKYSDEVFLSAHLMRSKMVVPLPPGFYVNLV